MKNVDNVSPVYYVMRGSIYLVITAREALIWEYDDRKCTADMTVTSLSLALRHLAQENATFEFVTVRIHKQLRRKRLSWATVSRRSSSRS